MANEDKTEQATTRKRQDVREKGQVAKSIELNSASTLLAGILVMQWLGSGIVQQWEYYAQQHLASVGSFGGSEATLQQAVTGSVLHGGQLYLLMTLPLLMAIMTMGVTSNVLQTGFLIAKKMPAFDFSKVNPLQGFVRMFSSRMLVDMLKAALKAVLIGYVIYTFFKQHAYDIVGLIQQDPSKLGPAISQLTMALFRQTTWAVVGIAVADYAYQRWTYEKGIRMTRQEVKDEFKRTEGDPMIKARIRQMQRAMGRRRMMADVARATVVVTNPTHLAVALRYDPKAMPAPKVVAKGERIIAQRIKEIAAQHHVPVIEDKPLARALFAQCDIGQFVPMELYQAVAQVIAFIFKQSGRQTERT